MSDLAETIALLRKLYVGGRGGYVDDICRMEREIWKVLPALLDAAEAGMRARDAALEEAAKEAERYIPAVVATHYARGYIDAVLRITSAIRALRRPA